jgi:hypothetical protein
VALPATGVELRDQTLLGNAGCAASDTSIDASVISGRVPLGEVGQAQPVPHRADDTRLGRRAGDALDGLVLGAVHLHHADGRICARGFARWNARSAVAIA